MPQIIPVIAGAIFTYALGATTFALIGGLIITWGLSALLVDDAGQSADSKSREILANVTSPVEPIPVIYGTRKVGGALVFAASNAVDNKYLHLVIVHGEGEIEAIDNVYIDDLIATDERYTVPVRVNIYRHVGTDNQVADSNLINQDVGWTTEHKLLGVAYTYILLSWDNEVFFGFPTITVDIRGKKILDVRDSVVRFSDNPALVIYDYLTNTRYGRAVSTNSVDINSFIVAANYCDEPVDIPNGSGGMESVKRYTCNGVLDTNQSVLKNLDELLSSMRGFLVYSAGKYQLIADKMEVTAFNFNEDNIVGSWNISLGGKKNRFNRLRGTFFNPDREWKPDIAIQDSEAFRTLDNGILLDAQILLPFTSNIYMAQQILEEHLKQSRFSMSVSFRSHMEGLRVEVGDVVSITHSTPGFTAEKFRVTEIEILSDGEVRIKCLQYNDDVYNGTPLSEISPTPVLNLPDPLVVTPPNTLVLESGTVHLLLQQDGTVVSRIFASWTKTDDEYVVKYEIQWKKVSETEYNNSGEIDSLRDEFYIAPVEDGVNYSVRVRSVNSSNVRSDFISNTHVTVGKTAPPGTPTTLTTASITQGIRLVWVSPGDADLSYIEVSRSEVNDRADASFEIVANMDGDVYYDIGFELGTVRYYWLRAVDNSGNISGYEPVSATGGVLGTAGGLPKLSMTCEIKVGLFNQDDLDGDFGFGEWLIMDDGTIGSLSSGATSRANDDTFDLFVRIWDNVIDQWAPVIGGRAVNPQIDWDANKELTLPRSLGRVLAQSGLGSGLTDHNLGEWLGAESVTPTESIIAMHTHGFYDTDEPPFVPGDPLPNHIWVSFFSRTDYDPIIKVGPPGWTSNIPTTTPSEGGASFSIQQPSAFVNYAIKL